jgi:hypothetical protein
MSPHGDIIKVARQKKAALNCCFAAGRGIPRVNPLVSPRKIAHLRTQSAHRRSRFVIRSCLGECVAHCHGRFLAAGSYAPLRARPRPGARFRRPKTGELSVRLGPNSRIATGTTVPINFVARETQRTIRFHSLCQELPAYQPTTLSMRLRHTK